ncbi:FadR/GntR family transcriptional regulator [Rhabdaerophilum sp.]|uniref:FadR/GntR family transcriptional regulator n=1 Tax=Rhabdaerophilum sp. TaxID=2717341 RepID=UPI0038D4FFCE
MRFEPVRPRRLAEDIADRIRAFILEGSLRPGDRLPAERALAEQFETSRPTIRDALMQLEQEGLLQVQRGGVHVADATARVIRDPLVALFRSDPNVFDDYLEFRGVMEGAAAYFAALRATEVDRDSLRTAFQRVLDSHESGNPLEEAHADADFHIAIYEACHNLTILHVMRGMAELLRNDVFYNRRTLYPRVGYREATVQQHRAIFDAIVMGDPAAAQRAAETHIAFVRQALDELKKSEARLDVALRRAGAAGPLKAEG